MKTFFTSATFTVFLGVLTASSSWAKTQPQDLRREFQSMITEEVLPKAQDFAARSLSPQTAADFIGSLMKFQTSFSDFIEALCTEGTSACTTVRYTEGIELAHNLALIPDVAADQLALPTRPFQQANEICAQPTTAPAPQCVKDVLQKEESLLLQTRDQHVAELGVRMAQDYSKFAMYLQPDQQMESQYNWYYDYALHYVEDRLSDY
ncbi:MAG: hypothetical protein ACKOX6_16055 [Bdellovibrio sp.]